VRTGQAVLVLFSLSWAILPAFGFIDLDAAIPPGDPDFRKHWVHEGTWGTLVTTLIVVPLLAAAVRPGLATDIAKQQAVLACCFVVAAPFCLDGQILVLSIGLGLSTLLWWSLARAADPARRWHGRLWWPLLLIGVAYLVLPLLLFQLAAYTPKTVGILIVVGALVAWLVCSSPMANGRDDPPRKVSWALLIVVTVSAGPWLAYAQQMASAARGGDYTGSGIDRLTAQAAFPICLLALPVVAAIGWLPIRLAVWPVAVAAAFFGFLGVQYPHHLATPGSAWGAAAMTWAVCLVVIAEVGQRRAGAS
jgi:predicted membrane protein